MGLTSIQLLTARLSNLVSKETLNNTLSWLNSEATCGIMMPCLSSTIFRAYLEVPEPKGLILGTFPNPKVNSTGLAFDCYKNANPPAVTLGLVRGFKVANIAKAPSYLEPLIQREYLLANIALTTEYYGRPDKHLKNWYQFSKEALSNFDFKFVLTIGRTSRMFAVKHINADVLSCITYEQACRGDFEVPF